MCCATIYVMHRMWGTLLYKFKKCNNMVGVNPYISQKSRKNRGRLYSSDHCRPTPIGKALYFVCAVPYL